ncbi:tRNA lysidine(34) synthetase TilS [Natronosporangium hydrolyticum]|uniref:tRNA(Ile)-lysidine synthase n=1 Tax=Natronosporangium hydrolyticum TaxID=2811111 RepID=A0A895Y9U1_9ACTN|nr:tRNA lysidine(34) synthetase TilS [Natronosporangium hydrolyticum]QSB14534.1 tRNA lysidine(34) synthetase TilS [Natronosporangium hydrolyticum]
MAALDPAVAALRVAVRDALTIEAEAAAEAEAATEAAESAVAGLAGGDSLPLALVACSGGADSLALAAAVAFVAPRHRWRAGLLTVDHGLQDGSGDRAAAVAQWAATVGLAPTRVLPVRVAGRPGGPEAAARQARYAALAEASQVAGAAAVLLAHTMDDQAETVLLALARGAGPRGLAGMPARRYADRVAWLRPLLGLRRSQTVAACAAQGLVPWDDPHNTDPAYARARVRATGLPALVTALGDRVVPNLAQTARQLAADTTVLDQLAADALAVARSGPDGLSVARLREQPDAVRTRMLHAWARQAGVPGSALSHRHVAALDALVTGWHGQGAVHLPGDRRVVRRGGALRMALPPAIEPPVDDPLAG